MDSVEYSIPWGAVKRFLDTELLSDNAIISVTLNGEGFIMFLGQELPAAGNVIGLELSLPKFYNIQELRPMLKERVQDNE